MITPRNLKELFLLKSILLNVMVGSHNRTELLIIALWKKTYLVFAYLLKSLNLKVLIHCEQFQEVFLHFYENTGR